MQWFVYADKLKKNCSNQHEKGKKMKKEAWNHIEIN